jgi:RHS repeat-associated protein
MTGSGATFIWRSELLPFGGVHSQSTATVANNLRFPGQYADLETSLYQNWRRDYRSGLGRYIEPDPLGVHDDSEPYSYARVNPLLFTDPSGERSRVCCTPFAGRPLKTFKHCFIQVLRDDSNTNTTYALHRVSWGIGCTYRNDPFDRAAIGDPATSCGDWNEGCKTEECIKRVHAGYPSPSHYFVLGQNSNTYASFVGSTCGLSSPTITGMWHTPGWGREVPARRPAAECPLVR